MNSLVPIAALLFVGLLACAPAPVEVQPGARGPGNAAVCGNGLLEPGEECDDGNLVNGDECSARCRPLLVMPEGPEPVETTNHGNEHWPLLSVAEEDEFSQQLCPEPEPAEEWLSLPSRAEDAGTVILLPRTAPHLLELPEAGVGYFILEVPAWGAQIDIATLHDTDVEVIEGEQIEARSWNPLCGEDGFIKERYAFHRWGAFTVRIANASRAMVRLVALHLNPED